MFDMFDDLFLESGFDDTGVTLTELESGFVWADTMVESSLQCDPFDFITEAMYANVINAERIQYAVLEEKYEFLRENGCEMVNEGVSVEGIKAFFTKAWNKLKEFYDAAIAKMVELQAKFKTLFESGKKRAELGMAHLSADTKVYKYVPADVVVYATNKFKAAAGNKLASEEIGGNMTMEIKFTTEVAPNFNTELDILKNYGKSVKDVKKARNQALKTVKDIEKEAIKAASDKYEKNHMRTDWAKMSNGIMSLSRDMVKLIMTRVNQAAKVINAAHKAGKDDYKKQKKAEKNKTATGESALFDLI